MKPYSRGFFNDQLADVLQSAKEIVPIVMAIARPQSVIDVGCGLGAWLSVFRELGITDIMGVDGDWVNKRWLLIPEENFFSLELTQPLFMNRQFDLVVSLEVAEHLPEQCAETFVDSLVRLGPLIVFSAAVPFQGGTHHLNEQWPDYWANYFRQKEYVAIDCIRKHIWDNDKVYFCYAQNILLFARQECLEKNELLKSEYERTNIKMLSLVHPKALDPYNVSLRKILPVLPSLIKNRLVGKIKNLRQR